MIVYQVNCQVNRSVADRWQQYFIDVHLNDVLSSGCFTGYSFRKGLENNGETILFTAEYFCNSEADLEWYNRAFAPVLKADINSKFGGEYSCSRMLFEKILDK